MGGAAHRERNYRRFSAFKADALWVGTSIDGVDGAAGRLKATAAAVTRFRTGLEGSRAYTLASRLCVSNSQFSR